uniref:Leucine-rich repeat-containing protein 51 n=1 Tax=Sinocyclocheilus rhinocerous TaxID=307959 RepID=A0A673FR73_9TELE
MLSDEPNPGARPLKRDSEQKILSATLRLNNNFLSDLTGLMDTLSALYAEPTRLAWLDISFNEFQHIHPVLTQLKELRLLYLHGNRICKLSEVDKLAVLPFLHTITLHGNPIVTERDYRYELSFLPRYTIKTLYVKYKARPAVCELVFLTQQVLKLRLGSGYKPLLSCA